MLVSAQGVGAVVAGLASSSLVKRYGEVAVGVLGLVLMSASVAGMAASPFLWVVLVFAVVCGASIPFLMVSYMTLLQRRTPHALIGRVSTAAEVVLTTPQAVSLGLGSLLVVLVDWRIIYAIIAVVVGLAAVYVAVFLRDEIGPHRRVSSSESHRGLRSERSERLTVG